MIKIGQITGAVGLKGEVKVYDYGEDLARYKDFEYVYIGGAQYPLKSARIQKNLAVLSLEGIADRNQAEKMRGKDVFITEEQLPKLPEGVYYIRDLIGFTVMDDRGNRIGKLKDIIKQTAQPLYVVETADGNEGYIPGVDEYILRTDIDKRVIIVKVIEGLFD